MAADMPNLHLEAARPEDGACRTTDFVGTTASDGPLKASVRAKKLCDLTSFDDAEGILRGMHLSTMLFAGCRVFQNAGGKPETYELSKTVEHLDGFISHNWDVSRALKYCALTLHYNFDFAVACSLAVVCLVGVLQVFGIIWFGMLEKRMVIFVGFGCRLLCFPTFVLGIACSRDVLAWFGFRGPMVFVDKCCINQVDQEKMRCGILKLGAFIHRSKNIVVLYTDIYLAKLWTVYEVACFLLLHPDEDMIIVPVHLACAFYVISFMFFCNNLIAMLLNVFVGLPFLRFAPDAVFTYICIWVWRQWCRKRQLTRESLQTFSVRSCRCAVEADREVVNGNIVFLMQACGEVCPAASVADVLDAFDALVKKRMPGAFAAALHDRAGFSWRQYLFFGWIANGNLSVDYFSRVAHGMPLKSGAIYFAEDLWWTFAYWPLAIFAVLNLSARRLDATGRKEFVLVGAVMVITIGLTFLTYVLRKKMASAALESDIMMGVLIATVPLGVALLLLVSTDTCWNLHVKPTDCAKHEHSGDDENDGNVNHLSNGPPVVAEVVPARAENIVGTELAPAMQVDHLTDTNISLEEHDVMLRVIL